MKTYNGYTAYEILSQASPSGKATIAVGSALMPSMIHNLKNIKNAETVLDELVADGLLTKDDSAEFSTRYHFTRKAIDLLKTDL